ncbi:MAG: class I SAM-dependent methyltransferase [Proteobacteria bacterium]|nr:class I SAM-dependent methyltransferase [Pseudomonadota bacterium]
MQTEPLNIDALKAKQKSMWMAGDYGTFSRYLEPGAMKFFARLTVTPGLRMLDIACGAGQLALPAARAGAEVTGLDIASNLIAQARARAGAEDLPAHFDEGDAEQLPYADGSFNLVVSLIGAMFAPRPERVAAEMVRVCRPGGRIVMGNWTAQGLIGEMFKINARYVPPPPGLPSPLLWGDEATVRERLRNGIADIQLTRRPYPIRYPFGVAELVEFYRTYYGPTQRAFEALDEPGQAALRRDLEQHWSSYNRATDGTVHVESEYLEVVAPRGAD